MKLSEKFTILLGVFLFSVFVIGLAWSISTGLAGFWRGLPFWIIIIFVLFLLSLEHTFLVIHLLLYLLHYHKLHFLTYLM